MKGGTDLKITAGLGRVEDYPAFIHAGADEVFCGYVPDRWYEHFNMSSPLNRREVRYAHVQIGSRNELKILHSMTEDFGAPAVLTMNALFYLPNQYPIIADIIQQCVQDGFQDFIIADPGLLFYLQDAGVQIRVHLSGETCVMNPQALAVFDSPMLRRIIFHRHLTIPEIECCIRSSMHEGLEYEAFILNERCHFHGGLCATVHCDDLSPMCQIPYRCENIASGELIKLTVPEQDPAVFGSTGCGLCAIHDLMTCGITHLKVVGRGNYTDCMLRDIQMIRHAVTVAESSPSASAYLESDRSLRDSCSHNCYYAI